MLFPLLSLLFSCTTEHSTPSNNSSTSIGNKPNIVFITMDTTRQDYLGCYGHDKARTDTIDGFSQKGYRFTNAYSSIPLTTPAHASMLTGLYPPHHGIRSNGDAILPDAIHTLPEILHDAGYQTVAAVSAFVTTKVWNLHQGFDYYYDDIEKQHGGRWAQERPAEDVIDDLLEWNQSLKDSSKPFFMWAHLYDPHHPHIIHPGYESFENSYDAEIAYMDDQIERLKKAINIDDSNTIWILLADHGEAFNGEHSEKDHGMFLYDETMRIPWIIQPYPALNREEVVETPISIVDFANTVLGLVGLDEDPEMDGVNIFKTVHSDPLYMEASVVQQRFGYHPELALTDGRMKLMATPNPHLYDLIADPTESRNIYSESEQWNQWAQLGRTLYQEEPKFDLSTPDAAVLQQLEMLGYMGGSEKGNELSFYTIDSKDKLSTILELDSIVASKKEGRSPTELIARFQKLIEEEPQ